MKIIVSAISLVTPGICESMLTSCLQQTYHVKRNAVGSTDLLTSLICEFLTLKDKLWISATIRTFPWVARLSARPRHVRFSLPECSMKIDDTEVVLTGSLAWFLFTTSF